MSQAPHQSRGTLVPVFPLPKTVIFPGVVLPVHLFESRYREMAREVLAKDRDERLLAMALLQRDYESLYLTKHAPIHDVVTVARVLQHREMQDGRFYMVLLGLRRARVMAENVEQSFRRAQLATVATYPDLSESESECMKRELGDLVESHRGSFPEAGRVYDELRSCGADLATQIDLLVYQLFPDEDCALKQRVLEEARLSLRGDILLRWLHDRVRKGGAGSAARFPTPPSKRTDLN